jgi:elongation factor P
MIDVNELRKGVTFLDDGNLFKVIDYHHHKPGRGKATIRIKARNLRTGANIDMTFNSSDKVQDIALDHHKVSFLYRDGDNFVFMDLETYDQPEIPRTAIGDMALYLMEGLELKITFYEGEPIDIEIPLAVEQEIAEVDMAVKGDTATGLQTKATTETGLSVSVPGFINAGDRIRIDTRTGSYVTRV